MCKELTLILDVIDNKKVGPLSVIEEAESLCGDGNVLAVVPRSGNLYEITVASKDASDELSTGPFVLCGQRYNCKAVYSTERVVSFLHLPAFIPDEEIRKKLIEYGAELKSEIKRRVHSGTDVADGTMFVVVKFPPNISSLPYSMKFVVDNKPEYIRVKHDHQSKVCSKCLSSDHLYADCPDNKCYRCDEHGHLSKNCPSEQCEKCNKYPKKCRCSESDMKSFKRQMAEREQEIKDSIKNFKFVKELNREDEHSQTKKTRREADKTKNVAEPSENAEKVITVDVHETANDEVNITNDSHLPPRETYDPEQKNIELCETENEVQMGEDQDDVNVNDRNENEDDDRMKVGDDADYNELELTEQCDNLVDLFDSKCPSPGDSKSENGAPMKTNVMNQKLWVKTKVPPLLKL
ncbi:unnamed protein product [Mytilus coruscus]|uniref:CCHC-type domain-containing protein n=1 Tax=Mytilus coruscus TaxID=42192 RepID=A0A6J8EUN3_MYTCO|nr:unnamed protein product [Mytilus coruscus]